MLVAGKKFANDNAPARLYQRLHTRHVAFSRGRGWGGVLNSKGGVSLLFAPRSRFRRVVRYGQHRNYLRPPNRLEGAPYLLQTVILILGKKHNQMNNVRFYVGVSRELVNKRLLDPTMLN